MSQTFDENVCEAELQGLFTSQETDEFIKSIEICLEKYPPQLVIRFSFALFDNFEKRDIPNDAVVEKAFHELMQILVRRVQNDNTTVHFDILSEISSHLNTAPLWLFKNNNSLKDWTKDMRLIIRGILQSHVGENQRLIAFKLTSALLRCYDIIWISEEGEFTHLVINLSCVELRLNLDSELNEDISEQRCEIINSCCSILESAIRLLVIEEEDACFGIPRQILYKMMDSILELMKYLFQYLTELGNNGDCIEHLPLTVAFPLHKLFSCFLEEGSELIDEKVLHESHQSFLRLEKLCENTALDFNKVDAS